jgi:predicted small lipoprotein YifL
MRAAIVLLALLALTGCGSGNDAAAPPPATVTVTETQTETETATTEPEVECSTAGLRTTLPEQHLPEPVAEVRERIFNAALACDYDELERIALEQGEGFTFTYGEGASAAAYWRGLEENGTEQPMRALVTILSLPYTRNESGSYAWPTAYDESPSEADWQALVDSGLYTQEQIDSMKQAGSYLGWRTAITADGDWQFFVAGD